MNRVRRQVVFLIAAILFAASSPAQISGEGVRLLPSEIKRLARDAFCGDKKKEEPARSRLAAARHEDRKPLFKEIAELPRQPARGAPGPGRSVHRIATPGGASEETPWVLRIPRSYSPRKPSPLLFRFHGSGDTAEAFDRNTNEDRAFKDFILVTPQVPSADRMGWNQQGGHLMLDQLYLHLMREFTARRKTPASHQTRARGPRTRSGEEAY